MSYSVRAYELAQELGEIAAANLREAGAEVDHDEGTGQFIIRDGSAALKRGRSATGTPAQSIPSEAAARKSAAPHRVKAARGGRIKLKG